MKKEITINELIRLRGLFVMAKETYNNLSNIERAMEKIVGATSENSGLKNYSLISEAIYSEGKFDADEFCRTNKIKIK